MYPGIKEHHASSPHAKTHDMHSYIVTAHDRHTGDEEKHDQQKDLVAFAHRAGKSGHKLHVTSFEDHHESSGSDMHGSFISAWKPKKSKSSKPPELRGRKMSINNK